MNLFLRRRGVASVIGTIVFLIVFMLALGTLAYAADLQSQTASAQEGAVQLASRRGQESLVFSQGTAGVTATNSGPGTVNLNHIVLKFPNGSVYSLATASALPEAGAVMIQSLVPGGVCSPGTATCTSKYNQIVSGGVQGSSVGVVTSLGNSFWFTPSGGVSGGGSTSDYYAQSTASTGSGTLSAVPGFSVTGVPGGTYDIDFQIGYYQSAGSSDLVYFGVTAPSDASILACVDTAVMSSQQQASCSDVSGATLPQALCYSLASGSVCAYRLTVFVGFGASGGSVQLEFKSNGASTAFVVQGSYMLWSRVT